MGLEKKLILENLYSVICILITKKYPNLHKLPNTLEDSLEMLNLNTVMTNAFGKNVLSSYIKLKKTEIESFKSKEKFDKLKPITKWERSNTLDC